MARPHDPERSSVAVGDDQGGRKGLLLLLLALIVAAILVALLIGSCGDDDSGSTDDGAVATATATATPAATPSPAATATPSGGGAQAPDGGGTLTAGSASLLGADAAGIRDAAGTDATGRNLEVLSLADGGFFIGTDESDRQYVEFGGKVGQDEPSSDRPQVGTRVDLIGPVRPAPEDPAQTLQLDEDDARTVRERGAYVNAETVTPASG